MKNELPGLIKDARRALAGDSNDAEHDTLFALVEALEKKPPADTYTDAELVKACRKILWPLWPDKQDADPEADRPEWSADTLDAIAAALELPSTPPPPRSKRWLLHVWGDVEPHIHGPYKSEKTRLAAAKRIRHADPGMQDGIFMTDAPIRPKIYPFSGADLQEEEQ